MGRTTLCGWRKGSHISNSRRYVMAQERPGERFDQRKLSVFSGVTLRNLFLIAAGALLFFWPLAQRAFASIVACSGCSCVSEVIDGLASCTAIAQCIPEFKLLIVNASIEYLCPGQPVAGCPILAQSARVGPASPFPSSSFLTTCRIFLTSYVLLW